MKRIIFDFLWLSIVIAAIFVALAYFFPELGRPAGAVTTVVASMSAGQMYGQRTKARVTSGFAWKVALAMTAASLILGFLWVLALEFTGTPVIPDGPGELEPFEWLMIIGFASLLVLLMTRFSFRWGVTQGVKTAR